jgi:hypothetical protein
LVIFVTLLIFFTFSGDIRGLENWKIFETSLDFEKNTNVVKYNKKSFQYLTAFFMPTLQGDCKNMQEI